MVNFREEPDLWWRHGVVVWQKEFKFEYATYQTKDSVSVN